MPYTWHLAMWMWIYELSEVTRIVTRESRPILQGHDPAVPESESGVFAASAPVSVCVY